MARYDGQSTITQIFFEDFLGTSETVRLDDPVDRIARLDRVSSSARIMELVLYDDYGDAFIVSPRVHCSVSMLSSG